jgi:hypothetical protein
MGKFFQSLKSLPDIYYNFRKINEDLEKIIKHDEASQKSLD